MIKLKDDLDADRNRDICVFFAYLYDNIT